MNNDLIGHMLRRRYIGSLRTGWMWTSLGLLVTGLLLWLVSANDRSFPTTGDRIGGFVVMSALSAWPMLIGGGATLFLARGKALNERNHLWRALTREPHLIAAVYINPGVQPQAATTPSVSTISNPATPQPKPQRSLVERIAHGVWWFLIGAVGAILMGTLLSLLKVEQPAYDGTSSLTSSGPASVTPYTVVELTNGKRYELRGGDVQALTAAIQAWVPQVRTVDKG